MGNKSYTVQIDQSTISPKQGVSLWIGDHCMFGIVPKNGDFTEDELNKTYQSTLLLAEAYNKKL